MEKILKFISERKKMCISIVVGIILMVGIVIVSGIVYKNITYKGCINKVNEHMELENYVQALKEINRALNIKSNVSEAKELKSTIQLLKKSKESYDRGDNLFNEKKYLDANRLFLEVNKEDNKRYELAQENAKKSINLYIEENKNQIKDLQKEGKYREAGYKVNDILRVDAKNEYAAKKEKEIDNLIKKQEKEEKVKKEAEKAKKIKNIIKIISVYPSRPNSAGGVDFNVKFKNTSKKSIKYITFNVTPYNAVGDVQTCDITRQSTFSGMVTGPIKAGSTWGDGYNWENTWYNNTIKSIKLNSIYIEYMDGTIESISKDEIKYAF